MSEKIPATNKFEKKYGPEYSETERKLMVLDPTKYEKYRDGALPIKQVYLSHPSEPFSLRVREKMKSDGTFSYTATLKDRGDITNDGIKRLEIETEISAATYHYYKRLPQYPIVEKMRNSSIPGVDIDFFDGENPGIVVEIEDPEMANVIAENDNNVIDISAQTEIGNESRAHILYYLSNGSETLLPLPDLDPNLIVSDVINHEKFKNNELVVIQIAGRSGSGKSTIVRNIKERLEAMGVSADTVSTDDYNKGKTFLDPFSPDNNWQNWDSKFVYDTNALLADIQKLANGEKFERRKFDFTTQEPTSDGEVLPVQVLLVEGIHAKDSLFTYHLDSLLYEVPTSLATCLGRRILRDFGDENRASESLPNPEVVLRYFLETAEPEYQHTGI